MQAYTKNIKRETQLGVCVCWQLFTKETEFWYTYSAWESLNCLLNKVEKARGISTWEIRSPDKAFFFFLFLLLSFLFWVALWSTLRISLLPRLKISHFLSLSALPPHFFFVLVVPPPFLSGQTKAVQTDTQLICWRAQSFSKQLLPGCCYAEMTGPSAEQGCPVSVRRTPMEQVNSSLPFFTTA